MEFQEVVDRRRMVRNFTAEPISADQRDRLLRNALHAPSAGFSQGWAFLVLETGADRDGFWKATTDPSQPPDSWLAGMRNAPLLIVALSHKAAYLDRYAAPDKGWTDKDESRWPVPYWHVDTGMAALLMLQTAVDEGLGACFFGVPPEHIDAFRHRFGVPDDHDPVGVVAVGHRAPDTPSPSLKRGRRSLDQVVHTGHW